MKYPPWQIVGYYKPVYGKTLEVQLWCWLLPLDVIGITQEYGNIVELAYEVGRTVILDIDMDLSNRLN